MCPPIPSRIKEAKSETGHQGYWRHRQYHPGYEMGNTIKARQGTGGAANTITGMKWVIREAAQGIGGCRKYLSGMKRHNRNMPTGIGGAANNLAGIIWEICRRAPGYWRCQPIPSGYNMGIQGRQDFGGTANTSRYNMGNIRRAARVLAVPPIPSGYNMGRCKRAPGIGGTPVPLGIKMERH